MSTLSAFSTISKSMDKWLSITAKSPQVANETKYFQNNIGNVKTADDLIKNPRLFNYAMTAFGMGDLTYGTGMMKQVLKQGVTSSTALANKLSNPNIKAFAKVFNFASTGTTTTSSSTLVSTVVNRYLENSMEKTQGAMNPGVQNALYFQQNAPKLTSIYGILGDKTLRSVVQTALGISPMTAAAPIDQQYAQLGKQIKLTDFQDPKKLQAFIARYAANYDVNNTTSTTNAGIANLFDTSSASNGVTGIDASLFSGMQNLKLGNF